MEDFKFIPPMKAQLSSVEFLDSVENDFQWAAGEKFDGYREQLHLGRTRNEMFSSAGNSHIDKVPQFREVIPELSGTIIDCEGMAPSRMLEDNASCFKSYPENAIAWQKQYGWAYLKAFDVLIYRGEDVMSWPFVHRIDLLGTLIPVLRHRGKMPISQEYLSLNKSSYYRKIVARTQAEGHEGVILKNYNAPYEPGRRSPNWLKVKREELVVATIVGFTPGSGKFEGLIGSIVFKGEGVEGSASGMDDAEREYITAHQSEYLGHKANFVGQSKTKYGALRHPRYKGLVIEEV